MNEQETLPLVGVSYACPHLGLTDDRMVMLSYPTLAHRCHAQPRPTTPDPDHQENICLTAQHRQCPFYSAPEPPETTTLVPVYPGRTTFSPPTIRINTLARPLASDGASTTEPRTPKWLPMVTLALLLLSLVLFLGTVMPQLLGFERPTHAAESFPPTVDLLPTFTATASPAVALVRNDSAVSASSVVLTPTVESQSAPSLLPVLSVTPAFETPTPEAGGAVFYLPPTSGEVGWWSSGSELRNNINDSFLYAGYIQGETFVSAVRFDLTKVPRGAEIRLAELRLTGLRQDRFASDIDAIWLIELIADGAIERLAGSDFLAIFSAPSSITLALQSADLAEDRTNVWAFDQQAKEWLAQQLLAGAKSITVRLKASTQEQDTLFAWDSGFGPETSGSAPGLLISIGPPPTEPPPLPTKPFIVATPTSRPENALTVVALAEVATAVAQTTGTYTPVPFDIVTPTPVPENLATVQAVARAKGLPAVIPHTPTPGNAATAAFDAAIATAVAQTTGTYTPVPTEYATPILVLPSPPPENILTAVARQTAAVSAELLATSTPMPFNAVKAKYVIATVTPENVLTAAVVSAQETANAQSTGTPIPTPWNQVVLLPTPLPVTPSATPTQPIEIVDESNATPTATPLPPLDRLPAELTGKILFRTTRNGTEEIFALDPVSNQLLRINDRRIYTLAQGQGPFSPDGQFVAIVQEDNNRLLQVKKRSLQYDTIQQLTAFGPNPSRERPDSYDPAWSPKGDLIAFVSNNTGNDEIYTIDPAGQLITQLTFNTVEWDKHPSWSPDGNQIVFFSNRDIGARRLWLMNADGSGQRELSSQAQPVSSNPQYEDWDPIWVR
jgi:hypothetical protein